LEYWLAAKIYNVNDNIEVKVVVIFKGELKSARGLLVHLALIVVLCKMLNCLNLDFIAYPLKNPKQLVNG
jgi:hypothetical protein